MHALTTAKEAEAAHNTNDNAKYLEMNKFPLKGCNSEQLLAGTTGIRTSSVL